MNQRPTIPRKPVLPLSQDWDALRAEGLSRIQALSGDIWTDHNTHDPGITTLELLAHALTDLSYRMTLPVADLLTGPDGAMDPWAVSGLIPAEEALPTAPRTVADYRRLLLRIPGLANAWAVARAPGRAETAVYADRLADGLSHQAVNAAGTANAELALSGLWDIWLDLEEDDRFGTMNDTALEYRVTSGPLKGAILAFDCLDDAFALGRLLLPDGLTAHAAAPVVETPQGFVTQVTLGFAAAPDLVLAPGLLRVVEDRPRIDRPALQITRARIDAVLADAGPGGLIATFWAKQLARAALVARATAALHANRGLSEDFRRIAPIASFRIGICADVEVAPGGDMEGVQAAVFHAIEGYLAPRVRFRTLDEMLAGGQGVDAIFNGPYRDLGFTWAGAPVFARPGFVTDADLAAADLRRVAQVSDIVNLIMDIPGVEAVHGVSLRAYDGLGLASGQAERWSLAVPQGLRAVFHPAGSKLMFHRSGIPYRAQATEFARTLAALRAEDRREVYVPPGQVLPAPQGRHRHPADFQPVQHDFPETYGIGPAGLSPAESPARIARARQFKGYLTVFDQILGDYLAQLAALRRIYSLDPALRQCRFSLNLSGQVAGTRAPFAAELLVNPALYADDLLRARLSESEDCFLDRRNRLLDHLIARFAERFADYATLLIRLQDDSLKAAEELIADKLDFLRAWPRLSRGRGQGADIRPEDPARVWDSDNVSGLEVRAGRLLGMANLARRDLACAAHFGAMFAVAMVDGGLRVTVPGEAGPLFVSDQVFATEAEGLAAARAAHAVIRDRGGIVVGVRAGTQRFEMTVMVPGTPLTHRPAFDTQADATAAARALIDRYDALLHADPCNSEGMHLIEHILLRPRAPGDALMPVCLPRAGPFCGDEDPYSFRVSVVLPYWPRRFRDMNFRAMVERTLREEAPAHVQLRICWAGQRQMAELDAAFRAWVTALRDGSPADLNARAGALIAILSDLSTVYPAATLHDCDDATDARPVRLGSSALGIF